MRPYTPPRLGRLVVVAALCAAAASPAAARTSSHTAAKTPAKFVITGGPGVGKTTMVEALAARGYRTVPEAARKVIKAEQRKERVARGLRKYVPGGVRRLAARVARRVVRDETKRGDLVRMLTAPSFDGALPWKDNVEFQQRVVTEQQRAEQRAQIRCSPTDAKGMVLDRCLIDGIAYLRENGTPTEQFRPALGKWRKDIADAGYTRVFFLDPLPTYAKDGQRKESPEQAKRIHERLFQTYTALGKQVGFDVVRVPAFPAATVQQSVQKRLDFMLERMQPPAAAATAR